MRTQTARWTDRIRATRPEQGHPKVLVGGIVSGNNLYGDPNNKEQRRILNHFDKAYAFEMEGYGLSMAVYKSRSSVLYNPQYLLIRGISDLVDRDPAENQAHRQQWTPYAVASAAAFARTLVEDVLAADGASVPAAEVNGQNS